MTRFFAVTRVKFLRYDPFQAKFKRAMAVLGKTWAKVKVWLYRVENTIFVEMDF